MPTKVFTFSVLYVFILIVDTYFQCYCIIYVYNTIFKKSIRLPKKRYYEIIFLKFKDDIRGTWKTINGILNKTKRKKSFPLFFKDGENITTDPSVITNKFNTFFTNIGLNLSSKIIMPQNKNFHNYLTQNINHNFQFQTIDDEITLSIINKLSPKTSYGVDDISTKLFKTIKVTLVKPITLIINQMLNSGIFPDKLKIAKIKSIHKKKMKHSSQIIDQFHFCLQFLKSLNK